MPMVLQIPSSGMHGPILQRLLGLMIVHTACMVSTISGDLMHLVASHSGLSQDQ